MIYDPPATASGIEIVRSHAACKNLMFSRKESRVRGCRAGGGGGGAAIGLMFKHASISRCLFQRRALSFLSSFPRLVLLLVVTMLHTYLFRCVISYSEYHSGIGTGV